MAGIIVQQYFQLSAQCWCIALIVTLLGFAATFFTPLFNRFRYSFVSGLLSTILFFTIGALFVWHKDTRNDKKWLGHSYRENDMLIATIEEPPIEKTKSIKANATANYLLQNKRAQPVTGKIILYFRKDSTLNISYGSQILLKKSLQEIKNAGNPGGFNYKRYSLFQGITHQVYLKEGEYEILDSGHTSWFKKFIFRSREKILSILRKNIPGDKELGLSEAMLIGYKDDLEQSLVQSYTNTGVVHIIAISGLHLGLIYWLLTLLLKPLQKNKRTRWLQPVLIITGLWLFTLLAGIQPSLLRSAIMFTCIVLGESLSKKTSIYNTMAVSAFVVLCINPFWLWDVGFQLSYAAVLSIIIFMKPVYNWFYIKNKILDALWKLNAVTIAAQILTVPLSIYHFHQFPNYFMLTNFLAVPLSSVILLGAIFLCVISFIPFMAVLTGKLLSWLIWLMNTYIEKIETLSFSLWDGLQISIGQTILLFLFICGISHWLMEKSAKSLLWGILALLGFTGLRSYSFLLTTRQEKIIVYNVPQKKAIDIIQGRSFRFIGDSDLLTNDFTRNFHLKPARTLLRITAAGKQAGLSSDEHYLSYRDKHILLIGESVNFSPQQIKPVIDLLVISKNPKLYFKKLNAVLEIKQVIFDGSVPAWKSKYWKKDCDSLHIPWYDVTMKGAFVMNLW
jgi:competence protein ComEC